MDLGCKGGKGGNLELGARSELDRRPLAHPGLPEVRYIFLLRGKRGKCT